MVLDKASKITQSLFSGDLTSLTAEERKEGFKDVPSYTHELNEAISLIDLLVEAKISPSKRQAREAITNGAISVNGVKVQDLEYVVDGKDRIDGKFTIIHRGKKISNN